MKLLDKLTLGAVGAVAAYYFVYLVLCLLGFDARWMSLFALAVIAAVTLPVRFRTSLERRLGRAFRSAQIAFTALLYVYIATVVVFWCYIGFDGAKTAETYAAQVSEADENAGSDTLVVVFGCRTYGYTPGDTLKLRLDEAYELLCALPGATCIVSGGQGSNETLPEATAMKAYLVKLGIDESRIIEEPDSHTTSENIRFTKALAEELGLDNKRLIGVSTAFHLPRIEALAERYWRRIEVCAAPSPSPAMYYVSMVREYLSYIKMSLFDKAVISA